MFWLVGQQKPQPCQVKKKNKQKKEQKPVTPTFHDDSAIF